MDGLMEAKLSPNILQGLPSYTGKHYQKKSVKALQKRRVCHHHLLPLSSQASNGFFDSKTVEARKENSLDRLGKTEVSATQKSSSTSTSTVKKPLGAKKTGKTGGFGARKLASKSSENLYDQKPEEPVVSSASSTRSNEPPIRSSFPSRFEYVENGQSTELNSGGPQVLSHVAPPKSSSLFSDFGMDNGFQKKSSSNSSKVKAKHMGLLFDSSYHSRSIAKPVLLEMFTTFILRMFDFKGLNLIRETDEARKKFSNVKSISSVQFFGDHTRAADDETQATLHKFSRSTSISSADLFGKGEDLDLSTIIPGITRYLEPKEHCGGDRKDT
ncbi:transcription factor MYC2-like [Hibiscus syriacus]|uniref:Transcription factor MYC2-like n=1 Tax=Hibiscus syriacus TaxID=106335 RepID=A0A6A2ZNM1_HIBSY|nr:transcription factor MYC2-like [Hibiscus syriacus]